MLDTIKIKFGKGKTTVFKRLGKKRFLFDDDGFVAVNSDIVLADGTKLQGITIHCEIDSGEHYGTLFFVGETLVDRQEYDKQDDFYTAMGKAKQDIFPYKYRNRAALHCDDIHVGEDGWSR